MPLTGSRGRLPWPSVGAVHLCAAGKMLLEESGGGGEAIKWVSFGMGNRFPFIINCTIML